MGATTEVYRHRFSTEPVEHCDLSESYCDLVRLWEEGFSREEDE